MARIKFDNSLNRYRIIFENGSHGWYSQRAVEDKFPDRDWSVVKNSNNWLFI